MRVSRRLDYAVRALLELTLRDGQGPVPTREIARSQAIPEAFAHQVLGALVKAGMVRTSRGSGGGHMLVRPPEATTLLDVVTAIEGQATRGPDRPYDAVSDMWDELDAVQRRHLSATTLSSLAQATRERSTASGYAI